MRPAKEHLFASGLLLAAVSTVHATDHPIAGVTPWQRPQGAPTITAVDRSGDWYTRALHGVSRPYPYSLRFLEDQGNWHTPFNRPGMLRWYDLRGWHQQ